MHIDTSRLNWTGPTIDPKTKKLHHLETSALCAAIAKGLPDGYELYTGFDEWCEKLGVPYFVGFRAASGRKDSASTDHSTYPRSETRETTIDGQVKQANWQPASAECHGLRATARIMSFAKSGKAIVGQFHGEKDLPMFKMQAKLIEPGEQGYVMGKKLYRLIPQHRPFYNGVLKANDKKEIKDPLGPVYEVAGAPFNYDFNVLRNWMLNVAIDGAQYSKQYDSVSYNKYDPEWYRKAGMYSQEDADEGSGVGDIRFYRMEMYETLAQPPVEPPVPQPSQVDIIRSALDSLKSDYLAGAVDLKKAGERLNKLSSDIKAIENEDERYALNAMAKDVKASLK